MSGKKLERALKRHYNRYGKKENREVNKYEAIVNGNSKALANYYEVNYKELSSDIGYLKESSVELTVIETKISSSKSVPSDVKQNVAETVTSAQTAEVKINQAISSQTFSYISLPGAFVAVNPEDKTPKVEKDGYVFMGYFCGSDLESNNSEAVRDSRMIILALYNNPNMKAYMCYGGSNTWHSDYLQGLLGDNSKS